ncbi:hypothetical protein [Kitasatospora sp. NPDC088134]
MARRTTTDAASITENAESAENAEGKQRVPLLAPRPQTLRAGQPP